MALGTTRRRPTTPVLAHGQERHLAQPRRRGTSRTRCRRGRSSPRSYEHGFLRDPSFGHSLRRRNRRDSSHSQHRETRRETPPLRPNPPPSRRTGGGERSPHPGGRPISRRRLLGLTRSRLPDGACLTVQHPSRKTPETPLIAQGDVRFDPLAGQLPGFGHSVHDTQLSLFAEIEVREVAMKRVNSVVMDAPSRLFGLCRGRTTIR